MFGKDSSNNYGYIVPGADTVVPFKHLTKIASDVISYNFSINVSSYTGYQNFTADNFILEPLTYTVKVGLLDSSGNNGTDPSANDLEFAQTVQKVYNPNTGIFTFTYLIIATEFTYSTRLNFTGESYAHCNVYLV